MTDKQIKQFQKKGIPDSVIADTIQFLEQEKAALLYLTMLSGTEYRVMYTNLTSGKSEARIFNVR